MNIELSEKFRKELELIKENVPMTCADFVVQQVRDNMKKLPPLPIGWRYDIDAEIVSKGGSYVCNLSFTPRQEFIVEGD